jgi:hypothetical protein
VKEFTMIGPRATPDDPKPLVPSLAIIVVVHGVTHLLYHHGDALEYWVEGYGAQETGATIGEGAPDGVHVWTGYVKGWRDYWGEYDEELVERTMRPITKEEWTAFNADEYFAHDAELRALAEWHARQEKNT